MQAYDPIARADAHQHGFEVAHAESPYEAARGAHAVLLATEWEAFRTLDLARLKQMMVGDILFDARNLLQPEQVKTHGFRYFRVGRVME